MNWNAPRYWPPPPTAFGSLPDSHSAVLFAQCLLWREVLCHSRLYLLSPLPLPLPVPLPVPPLDAETPPLDATADEVIATAVAPIRAMTAIRARTILSLGATAPRDRFNSSSFVAYGVS